MKGIVVYQSKYGATSQYAQWVAEALDLPFVNKKSVTPLMVAGNDLIIIGSPLYVGKLLITKWLEENAGLLGEKKVLLFIVCGSACDDPILQQQIINNNFGHVLSKFAGIFFLPGRCSPSRLSWKDRLLLKIGAWREKDPERKKAMKEGFDKMGRDNLYQLLARARELMNEDKHEEVQYVG